jgi:predicted nucleotidyltransferase
MYFLEALHIDGLILADNVHHILIPDGKFLWVDEVDEGRIRLETTKRPSATRENAAGDLTIIGKRDNHARFKAMLHLYEVEYEGSTKPEDVELKYQYHETLNPLIWSEHGDGKQMIPNIREKLLESADAFIKSLKIDDLEVLDIVLTGSNANYNWTEASDIDLHVLVNFDDVKSKHGDLVDEYFNAKKINFNTLHNITIGGHEVEFYVQCSEEDHMSSGVYSIQDEKWNVNPERKEPTVDDDAVKVKTAEMMNMIDTAVVECNIADTMEKLMDKLKKLRQSGLEEAGEFSTENLVFKTLRHNGYLKKLADCRTKAFDRELSIEDEEWSSLCEH